MPKIPEFSLETASGVPFYRQIIRQIEDAVITGMLPHGTKLPTIRSLAIQLKINPNTIAKAYAELELRGVVVTQVGSGTYISDKNPVSDPIVHDTALKDLIRRTISEFAALGISRDAIAKILETYEEES